MNSEPDIAFDGDDCSFTDFNRYATPRMAIYNVMLKFLTDRARKRERPRAKSVDAS
jgi:hypothetical protein